MAFCEIHVFLVFFQNGLLSSLPYIGMMLLSPLGLLFDQLRRSGKYELQTLRKIFNSIGNICVIPDRTFHIS